MFSQNADLFFEDPSVYRPPPGTYGILYLLRRDILTCLGRDPGSGQPIQHQTLWPGAMAVLAGVDLLAKFLDGSDAPRKVGQRFRRFLGRYFDLVSADEEETLYQLRNSLLHSFGLYSTHHGHTYRFTVTADNGPLLCNAQGDRYLIDLLTLHARFEAGVANYRADLDTDAGLQANFGAVFPDYGTTRIGIL
jgi:hypothetical protein